MLDPVNFGLKLEQSCKSIREEGEMEERWEEMDDDDDDDNDIDINCNNNNN
jgi:hypothetical protein